MRPEIHNIGAPGCVGGCHLPTVTVSGWFRRKYWIRCWECDLRVGPFRDRSDANVVTKALNWRWEALLEEWIPRPAFRNRKSE